jgi:hypothetical protein
MLLDFVPPLGHSELWHQIKVSAVVGGEFDVSTYDDSFVMYDGQCVSEVFTAIKTPMLLL